MYFTEKHQQVPLIEQENQASHTVPAGLRPAKSIKCKGNQTKRYRTTFTELQLNVLKAEFAENNSLHSARRKKISATLGLPQRVIKVWFQNRRQGKKKDKRLVRAGYSSNSTTKSAPTYSQNEHYQSLDRTNEITSGSTTIPVYTIHLHWSQQETANQHQMHVKCGKNTLQQQITQHVYLQQDDAFKQQQMHGTPHHFGQNQQQYIGHVGQQMNHHPSVSQQKDYQQDTVQQLIKDICRVLPHELWQEVMAYTGSCSSLDTGPSNSPEVADTPAILN